MCEEHTRVGDNRQPAPRRMTGEVLRFGAESGTARPTGVFRSTS